MLVAGKWIYQVIRQRVNDQKATKQERSFNSISNAEPQSGKSEDGWNKKANMPSKTQIVSSDDVGLRGCNPKVHGAFQAEADKQRWMFADKLPNLLLLFLHETYFA